MLVTVNAADIDVPMSFVSRLLRSRFVDCYGCPALFLVERNVSTVGTAFR
jgi:hypothetical protein